MKNTQVIARIITRNIVRVSVFGALLASTGCEVGELDLDVLDPGAVSDGAWLEVDSDTDGESDTASDSLEEWSTDDGPGDDGDDPCAAIECDSPPESHCDRMELVRYAPFGTCHSSAGESLCVYPETRREDCEAHGRICQDGACVDSLGTTDEGLFISEVMANPTAVTDAAGEWLEIGNAGQLVLDLYDLVVDNGTQSFVIGEHILLVPGGVATFGRNSDPATNGSVYIDMSYSGLSLTNSAGELALYRDDQLIDHVAWQIDSELTMPAGASIQRDPETFDWCVSSEPWSIEQPELEGAEAASGVEENPTDGEPSGDRGTPAQINPPCADDTPAVDAAPF